MSQDSNGVLHKRCKELTGEAWCPYPSEIFIKAIFKTDDKTAIKLIEERRKISFPTFMAGEPQIDEISKILTN